MRRRVLALFCFGAVVISFFDGFHTYSGTTEYPNVLMLKMAWWAPLLFGSVVALGGLVYDRAYRWLRGPARLPTWERITTAFVLFGFLYFASGFLPIKSGAMLIVLVAGAFALWLMLDGSPQGIALAVMNAVAGCSTEIFLTRLGAFRHLQADALGIPIWLPGLYLAAGPAIGQLARKVLAGVPSRVYEES